MPFPPRPNKQTLKLLVTIFRKDCFIKAKCLGHSICARLPRRLGWLLILTVVVRIIILACFTGHQASSRQNFPPLISVLCVPSLPRTPAAPALSRHHFRHDSIAVLRIYSRTTIEALTIRDPQTQGTSKK